MLANPITWVVVAIVALVAVLVLAYKRSETFRRIVDGAFRGVTRAAQAAWRWIKGNWPLILAIITGPVGIAVRFVVRHFDTIRAKVRSIPAAIRSAFGNARTLLTGAGRNIVQGLWNGVQALRGWLIGKVQGFITEEFR
jgi:phage-related protein